MRISQLIGISSRLVSSRLSSSQHHHINSPGHHQDARLCTRLILSCLSSPPFPHKRRRITHPIRRESNSQTPRHAYPLYSLHKPAISSMKTPIIIPTIKRSEAKQSKEIRNVVTPLSLSHIPLLPSQDASTSRPEHRRAEKRKENTAQSRAESRGLRVFSFSGRNAHWVLKPHSSSQTRTSSTRCRPRPCASVGSRCRSR
jgi:hypothetical protein